MLIDWILASNLPDFLCNYFRDAQEMLYSVYQELFCFQKWPAKWSGSLQAEDDARAFLYCFFTAYGIQDYIAPTYLPTCTHTHTHTYTKNNWIWRFSLSWLLTVVGHIENSDMNLMNQIHNTDKNDYFMPQRNKTENPNGVSNMQHIWAFQRPSLWNSKTITRNSPDQATSQWSKKHKSKESISDSSSFSCTEEEQSHFVFVGPTAVFVDRLSMIHQGRTMRGKNHPVFGFEIDR